MAGKQRKTDKYMRRVRCYGLMRLTLAFCFSERCAERFEFSGLEFLLAPTFVP